MKYYKFLTEDNTSEYAHWDWAPYLPRDGQPGEWTPAVEGTPELCENGYHGCNANQLIGWVNAQLFEVEADEIVDSDDKFVCRRMRLVRKVGAWNDKTLRLFACWCVRQVWHLLTDERSKTAVEVAEKFANGEATSEELAAAWDAAWAAAGAAAGYAARDAAWAAAGAAAWDAAWDAAGAAARAAAWAAAGAAAWAAAWNAAGAAARAAERRWQTRRLLAYLEGRV